jgi:hypothetical protein
VKGEKKKKKKKTEKGNICDKTHMKWKGRKKTKSHKGSQKWEIKKQNHMKGMQNEKRKEIVAMGAWNQCFKTLAPNPYTCRHVPYTYTLKT